MGKDEKKKGESLLPPGAAKGAIRDNAEVICFAVMLILFFKTFVGQQFTIPSASMRNTLMIGDHLLANKFIFAQPQWAWESKLFPMREARRGDIIVFRYPMNRDMDYVKRCVALPGDRVEIKNKRLYVNGSLITGPFEHHRVHEFDSDRTGELDQPEPGPWPLDRDAGKGYQEAAREHIKDFLPPPPRVWPYDSAVYPGKANENRQGLLPLGLEPGEIYFPFRDDLAPFTVPPGQVMAMGDNRENSEDSRYWGFVPVDHLRGRPFMVWWSYREGGDDDTRANAAENPGDVIANLIDGARYFFVRTRWARTGTMPK